jgi:hypothetical protein
MAFSFQSCKEDTIVVPKAGDSPFTFNRARVELRYDQNIVNEAIVEINTLGYVICDSIRISNSGFSKDYSFIGSISRDSSISIILTPKDSASTDKLKFTAKQSGNLLSGSLLYCENVSNCEYSEIGHIVGFYTTRYEGFYYSPLFLGEFYVYPL